MSVPCTLTVAADDPGGDDGTEDGTDPPGQCEDPRTVLTDEHVDLLVQVKDPEAAITVPAGAEHAFLGTAGDPLWMIPQPRTPAIVRAGWSTEELAPGALSGDVVELMLTGVTGPGEVEVFQTAGLGAARRGSSALPTRCRRGPRASASTSTPTGRSRPRAATR
ncbi:choice-of-anchor M domain-containing protein [Jiangella alba]|uniref:choice-of-anchor M domain-containing protein n=1 Tax=Jiangella alba TaxID=561176 RepID=UPI00083F1A80|nr:choice-of-anchor M domain-containing protein [Jiangella alba]